MNREFNTTFNHKGHKARFIYQKNELVERSYQIFEFKTDKGKYEPVGEYIVLDTGEDTALSDRKVSNLVHLLNGQDDVEDLGNLTQARTLFNVVPDGEEHEMKNVIFRAHNGRGVSEENALFRMQKEVFGER